MQSYEYDHLEEEEYQAAWSLFKVLGKFKVMNIYSLRNIKNWDGSLTIQFIK